MKKKGYVLFINLVILTSIFGLLEIGVRLLYPEIQFPGTDKNLIKENVFESTPGLYPNSEGISNGVLKKVSGTGFWQYSTKSQDASSKILFLGDSVTMGIGVESDSTFAGRIHHSTDSISVLNPSLIGYSNADYLNISRNLIQSDSLSNQINSTYLYWCLNDIYANEFSTIGFTSDSILDRLVALFRNHSKLFHFLKATLTDRPKQYFAHDVKFYSESDPNFKQAIRNLASIDSIAAENDIPFTIVLLPYEYQLRDDARITSSPYNVFEKHLSTKGIKYLNLTDQLNAYKIPSQELYLYGDGIHFSTLGHKLIAEELLKSLN